MNENIMLTKVVPTENNLSANKKQTSKVNSQTGKPSKEFNNFFKKANLETLEDDISKVEKSEVDLLSSVVVPLSSAVWVDMSDNGRLPLMDGNTVSASLEATGNSDVLLMAKDGELKIAGLFTRELLDATPKTTIDQNYDVSNKTISNQGAVDLLSKLMTNQGAVDLPGKLMTNQGAVDLLSKLMTNQGTVDLPSKLMTNQGAVDLPGKLMTNQGAVDLLSKLMTNQGAVDLPGKLMTNQGAVDLPGRLMTNQGAVDLPGKLMTNQGAVDLPGKLMTNQGAVDLPGKLMTNQGAVDLPGKLMTNQGAVDLPGKLMTNQGAVDLPSKFMTNQGAVDLSAKAMINQEVMNVSRINPNSKIDDLDTKRIMEELSPVITYEKKPGVDQAQLLNLLKGKSGINVMDLTEAVTAHVDVPKEVVPMGTIASVNDSEPVDGLSLIKDVNINTKKIGENLKVDSQQKLVVEEPLVPLQKGENRQIIPKQISIDVSDLAETKGSELGLIKTVEKATLKDQSQTQGESKGGFLPTESIVPKQEAATPIQTFAVPVTTEVSRSTQVAPQTPETPATLEKYNISDQIIEQARMIKSNESTQMVIKLRPEHLGELTLKVSVENGVVSASFHSDNVNVRAAIETSLMQLKQEFAAQGLKVDNVGVYSGLGQFLSDGQNQANREQQNTKSKNRKINLADFEEENEKVEAAIVDGTKVIGVDYLI